MLYKLFPLKPQKQKIEMLLNIFKNKIRKKLIF